MLINISINKLGMYWKSLKSQVEPQTGYCEARYDVVKNFHTATISWEFFVFWEKISWNYWVQIFWEGHKNLANLPLFFWHYLVASNYKWKMGQISMWPSQKYVHTWTLRLLKALLHTLVFRSNISPSNMIKKIMIIWLFSWVWNWWFGPEWGRFWKMLWWMDFSIQFSSLYVVFPWRRHCTRRRFPAV